jgi:hypothetical protein
MSRRTRTLIESEASKKNQKLLSDERCLHRLDYPAIENIPVLVVILTVGRRRLKVVPYRRF